MDAIAKAAAGDLAQLAHDAAGSLKHSDAAGLAQPFAAIVLGEVAAADRLAPFMSAADPFILPSVTRWASNSWGIDTTCEAS
ncbi:hypothetical protein [Duganella aceris]|uniref:Uncharacterized protein n=1 Tax=Duganella aceris TaxID=2703883 RepID=A0ABX0FQJ7_9BURK|nr:hypothetical protein [Duganella aceris]NGZ86732.1 hypothetical protein [Duganella aceris]